MALTLNAQPIETPSVHRFEVCADGLGRYTIDVSLPRGYEQSDTAYPVVLTTDGNILFDIVQVQLHGGFAQQQTALPPSILVGVGYLDDATVLAMVAASLRGDLDRFSEWERDAEITTD